mmetsp:Transcript_98420/g.226160  ORF Transcript_98420/g.226160 Transcript_98420/m.226160 type:complete len:150 (-) Transcript_98420:34-483(-)
MAEPSTLLAGEPANGRMYLHNKEPASSGPGADDPSIIAIPLDAELLQGKVMAQDDDTEEVWSPCTSDDCAEYGEDCESPVVFDITMCKSWTCKDDGCGPAESCVNICADIQAKHPRCRCPEWNQDRETYYAGMAGAQYEAWKAKQIGSL